MPEFGVKSTTGFPVSVETPVLDTLPETSMTNRSEVLVLMSVYSKFSASGVALNVAESVAGVGTLPPSPLARTCADPARRSRTEAMISTRPVLDIRKWVECWGRTMAELLVAYQSQGKRFP